MYEVSRKMTHATYAPLARFPFYERRLRVDDDSYEDSVQLEAVKLA